jgi:hypothetical protein
MKKLIYIVISILIINTSLFAQIKVNNGFVGINLTGLPTHLFEVNANIGGGSTCPTFFMNSPGTSFEGINTILSLRNNDLTPNNWLRLNMQTNRSDGSLEDFVTLATQFKDRIVGTHTADFILATAYHGLYKEKMRITGNSFLGNGIENPTKQYGGEGIGFNFNANSSRGNIWEFGDDDGGDGSGIYMDADYVTIWSPGDYNRIIRFYDEDGMDGTGYEVSYIDGVGNYVKSSDLRKKENILTLSDVNFKIKQIRGVQYNFKMNETKKFKLKSGKAPQQIGLIAQEVEQVFPELVSEDEHGNKFVNYDGMIPVLLEAIKEHNVVIDSLKNAIELLKSEINSSSISSGNSSANLTNKAKLLQNAPNPFNINTEISYYLPNNTNTATFYVYNLNGTQIKSLSIQNKGWGKITITASELKSGMYLYSLIADGKEVDTKRMILTD